MKHRACISGWILTAVLAVVALATAQSTKPSPLSGTTAGAKLAPIQKAAAARKAVEQKSALAAETEAQAEPAAPQRPATSAPAAPASRPKVLRGDRRDPFESMLRDKQAEQQQQPACGTHIRSITVGQVVLTGIVKMPTGYIAMISAPPNRTYFLREGNAVCNGTVQAITPDSIVFMEDVIDPSGKPAKREVIKKIPADAK